MTHPANCLHCKMVALAKAHVKETGDNRVATIVDPILSTVIELSSGYDDYQFADLVGALLKHRGDLIAALREGKLVLVEVPNSGPKGKGH